MCMVKRTTLMWRARRDIKVIKEVRITEEGKVISPFMRTEWKYEGKRSVLLHIKKGFLKYEVIGLYSYSMKKGRQIYDLINSVPFLKQEIFDDHYFIPAIIPKGAHYVKKDGVYVSDQLILDLRGLKDE